MVEIEEDRVDVLSERAEHVVRGRELAEILPLQQNGQLDLALVENLVDIGRHLSQPVALGSCLFHLVLNFWDAYWSDLAVVIFGFVCLVWILFRRELTSNWPKCKNNQNISYKYR